MRYCGTIRMPLKKVVAREHCSGYSTSKLTGYCVPTTAGGPAGGGGGGGGAGCCGRSGVWGGLGSGGKARSLQQSPTIRRAPPREGHRGRRGRGRGSARRGATAATPA